jgi:glycogen synthase
MNSCPDEPLFLFIGRFSYDKGVSHVVALVHHLAELRARLVMMGQHNTFPKERLLTARRNHPSYFQLIDDSDTQDRMGMVVRMAADFSFMPSFTESFGLVAVEALLFGSWVVTSAVGGLKEFLKDGENSFWFDGEELNRFDVEPSAGKNSSMLVAVRRAVQELKQSSMVLDKRRRLLVRDAVALQWSSDDDGHPGAVQAYAALYEHLLQT